MPDWIVRPTAGTVQPETSTAVVPGLNNENDAPPLALGPVTSPIVTDAVADCEAGTGLPAPVLLAITLRRSARPSRKALRASAGV